MTRAAAFAWKIADTALAALAAGAGAALLGAARLTAPRRPARHQTRRIAYLGTGAIAQVFPRNGVNLFLERECSDFDGFFAELWNLHFPAGGRGELDLTPRHHLLDFDLRLPAWMRRLRRTSMMVRQVAFLAWALRLIRTRRISVLTATNPYLQGLNAALLAFACRIPFVVMVTRDHDFDWEELGRQAVPSVFGSRAAEKRAERWVFRRASAVIADRRHYRDYAIRNGAHRDHAVATTVLADEAYVTAPRKRFEPGWAQPPPRGPVLTHVGRLDPEKLVLQLVDCLAVVRRRFPSAVLACAGRGSLEDAMQARARELGVADGLCLLGTVPLSRLPELLAASEAVIGANMGYTLVEAAFMGLPAATYAYEWHGEVVQTGRSGFLVPYGDRSALAAGACEMLADPGLTARLGGTVRRFALREHARATVIPRYQRAYAAVLEGRAVGEPGVSSAR